MSLAQRVRRLRFAKGLGPQELASRAKISMTALYQIEAGRTGHPRAATLGRIAKVLEVPTEDLLLGSDSEANPSGGPLEPPGLRLPRDHHCASSDAGPPRSPLYGADVSAVSIANATHSPIAADAELPWQENDYAWVLYREGELISKLHDLLHSPVGRSIARILEELHRVLPRSLGQFDRRI